MLILEPVWVGVWAVEWAPAVMGMGWGGRLCMMSVRETPPAVVMLAWKARQHPAWVTQVQGPAPRMCRRSHDLGPCDC